MLAKGTCGFTLLFCFQQLPQLSLRNRVNLDGLLLRLLAALEGVQHCPRGPASLLLLSFCGDCLCGGHLNPHTRPAVLCRCQSDRPGAQLAADMLGPAQAPHVVAP